MHTLWQTGRHNCPCNLFNFFNGYNLFFTNWILGNSETFWPIATFAWFNVSNLLSISRCPPRAFLSVACWTRQTVMSVHINKWSLSYHTSKIQTVSSLLVMIKLTRSAVMSPILEAADALTVDFSVDTDMRGLISEVLSPASLLFSPLFTVSSSASPGGLSSAAVVSFSLSSSSTSLRSSSDISSSDGRGESSYI